MRLVLGRLPSEPPVKLYNTCSAPLVLMLKTTPSFDEPPLTVVPYSVPFTSVKAAVGNIPSEPPVKACNMCSAPLRLTL
jgi:hypothetical protein